MCTIPLLGQPAFSIAICSCVHMRVCVCVCVYTVGRISPRRLNASLRLKVEGHGALYKSNDTLLLCQVYD